MAASKKPHFHHVPRPSSTNPQITSKSHSIFYFKSLFILVIILVIPFFPSQAPQFLTDTVLTRFWEFFHLLFIGIAVSYGLFSRITAQTVTERTTLYCSSTDASHEYLSGISQFSSMFEDLRGSHELHSYGSNQFLGKNHERVVEESVKVGSFVAKDGVGGVTEGGGERRTRVRRSEGLKGESFVVVSNGKDFVDKRDEIKPLNLPVRSLRSRIVDNDGPESEKGCGPSPKIESEWKRMTRLRRSDGLNGESLVTGCNGKDFTDKRTESKPLGLPVRRLRSRIVDNDKTESRKKSEPSSKFEIKGNDDVEVEVAKIQGVVPKTLEKKFEGVAGLSTIPWRSRSGMREKGGERNSLKPPAHSRPQSVGDLEFEHLRSKSFIDSTSSTSPKLRSSKVGNLESEMDIMQPVISVSHPKVQSLDAEASFGCTPRVRVFGSMNSSSPELRSPKVENSESKMDIMQPVISVSHPKVWSWDPVESLNGAKPRSPSFGSMNSSSPELRSSKVEKLESKTDTMQPVISVSHSKVRSLDAEESFNGANQRSRSFGSTKSGSPEIRSSNVENLDSEMEIPVISVSHTKVQAFDAEESFNGAKPRSGSFGSTNSSSPELRRSKVEKSESKTDVMQPVVSVSHPKASSNGAKPRSHSLGASAEMSDLANFEFNLRKSGDSEEEDRVGKGKRAIEPLESDTRSPALAKVLSKAKSVRTIKPRRYSTSEKGQCSGEVEADSLLKIRKGEEPEDSWVQNQNYESIFPMPKPKPILPEMHNEEKESVDHRKITESDEDTKSYFEKSSDEDDVESNIDTDAEFLGSEVDRKAGEFIAKFREQIRLQRLHQQDDTVIGSMKGQNMGVAAKNF